MNARTETSADDLARLPAFTSPWQRLQPLRAVVRHLLTRLQCGTLHVQLPDGQVLHARGAQPGPEATLRLHRWRPLWRLLAQGDLGMAISYRDGDWSADPLPSSPSLGSSSLSPRSSSLPLWGRAGVGAAPPTTTATSPLTNLLLLGAANESAWKGTLQGFSPWRAAARALHRFNDNTRRGSRRNIAFHYDLGNAFYAQWLDAGMQYSSALYEKGDETLEQAQAAKLQTIVDLLAPAPGQKVLEIGCGWGGLAKRLAVDCGAHVTGLTLSTEQLAHAQQEAQRAGVADRVDLRLQDYRDVEGQYERIVSIEMLEAVGEQFWPGWFQVLHDRLAPGGHAVVQVITIDERWFDEYRKGADFIQRFIFPGGMLPTRTALREHAERAGLVLEDCLQFGESYAATLADWRERFLANWERIAPLGFDDKFRRLWEYYLGYCEAGFRSGRIGVGVYQLRGS